jgi:hypothetical protein
MTDQRPRSDYSLDVNPHAYDPIAHPELFEGVLTRRVPVFVCRDNREPRSGSPSCISPWRRLAGHRPSIGRPAGAA